jgi:hypothetical protein
MITANQRRLKVGVLTPHAAAGPEIEIPDMSQGRVTVTVGRIRAPEKAAGTESIGAPTALRALTGRKQWTATQRASATAPSMSWPQCSTITPSATR